MKYKTHYALKKIGGLWQMCAAVEGCELEYVDTFSDAKSARLYADNRNWVELTVNEL